MPKVIHRGWLGGEMPENFKQYGLDWAELNPGWEVHDWTEEEIFDTEWVNQPVVGKMREESVHPYADKVAFYTHVMDVVGYELVNSGGWYFNCDLKPLKSLDTLDYSLDTPAIAYEDDLHLVNMAMYSPERSQFFDKVIENLPKRYFGMPMAFMHETTGVQLIMQTLGEYDGPLTRFHRDVFNPVHFSQVEYGQEPDVDQEFGDETVAVHLWGHRGNRRGHRILR